MGKELTVGPQKNTAGHGYPWGEILIPKFQIRNRFGFRISGLKFPLQGSGPGSSVASRGSDSLQRGFTLLELIIVLTIITILLSVGIPAYQAIIVRARESVLKQNLYLLRRQIQTFAADQGRYPQSLQELVDRGYLRELPLDPITDSRETWQEIKEEGESLGEQPGVVDVKSGAEGISSEGTPYSEW